MTRGLFARPFEETLSNTYDAIEARNRRDDEARDRSDALLKGNTIEETMANVYDHIQEREARKERTAVLTSLPEPDLGGDTIEETMANVYDHIQEREARKDRSAVLTSLPEPDIGGDTIEETLSKTYDVIQARNRRDKEARDRRAAPLKGNMIEDIEYDPQPGTYGQGPCQRARPAGIRPKSQYRSERWDPSKIRGRCGPSREFQASHPLMTWSGIRNDEPLAKATLAPIGGDRQHQVGASHQGEARRVGQEAWSRPGTVGGHSSRSARLQWQSRIHLGMDSGRRRDCRGFILR